MNSNRAPQWQPHLSVIGLVFILLLFYAVSSLSSTDTFLIPLGVLAVIIGVLFEASRLTENISTVFLCALAALFFSLASFFPFKRERVYILENHIQVWPYYFIFTFALFTIVLDEDRSTPRLTEGITLLQSLAVIYWFFDQGLWRTDSLMINTLMGLGFIGSLFSLLHALTPLVLSSGSRLLLSIWSSLIMFLFSVDNIIRVYQDELIETTTGLPAGFSIAIQYFLLGVSSIYATRNFLMLIGFLPGKGTFFNKRYFREVQNLMNAHVKRYSERQVNVIHSFGCILFAGTAFYLNYHYSLVPGHQAIWLVFLIFPIVISAVNFKSSSQNDSYTGRL